MFDIVTNNDAKSNSLFRRSALFAAVLATAAGNVWAQEQDGFLDEVIVTASKRAETPVSYTHLTLPTICSV